MHNPSSPKHLTKQNVDVQRLGRTEAGEEGTTAYYFTGTELQVSRQGLLTQTTEPQSSH